MMLDVTVHTWIGNTWTKKSRQVCWVHNLDLKKDLAIFKNFIIKWLHSIEINNELHFIRNNIHFLKKISLPSQHKIARQPHFELQPIHSFQSFVNTNTPVSENNFHYSRTSSWTSFDRKRRWSPDLFESEQNSQSMSQRP